MNFKKNNIFKKMEKEKIFEYLSEIGILLFDNINSFLDIYSNNSQKFNSEQDKLKNTLFLYLQETTKNEQYLNSISTNLIETFYNKQAISRYNALKNLVNILNIKLLSTYNFFTTRILYYISKNKNQSNTVELSKEVKDKNEIENKQDNFADNDKQKENEIKKSNKKKKKTVKKVNKYKNNWYKNIYDGRGAQHGEIFLNNNYDINFLDNSKNSDNINYNYNNRYKEYELENLNQYKFNNENIINNFNSYEIPLKYYIPKYNIRNSENLNSSKNMYLSPEESLKNYDFFESQEKHEQKVKNKLLLLESEREENLKKQCTFKPKINSQRTYGIIPKQIIDKKFEKLYNDSIINQIKRDENIKKHLNDIKFKPNLKETENYVITSTFQERLIKSINMKDQRKKDINEIDNSKMKAKKDETKNHIINWDKIAKENKEKYISEGHYGHNLEKKKKMLENIGNRINNNNNIIIKESSNIQISNNISNENSKEKIVINENNNNKEEEKKDKNSQKNINEKYKSSIKYLLNNNSLLKKEY